MRRQTAVAAVGVLLSLPFGAVAWACVPQPTIVSVQPRASAAAGGQVTVAGENFDGAPIEIRWNGLQGTLLGTGTGPSFAIAVTVPDDQPGLYVLTALSRQPGGGVGGTARASFQIVENNAPPATAPPQAEGGKPDGEAEAGTPVGAALVAGTAAGVFAAGAGTTLLCTRRGRRRGE